MAEAEQYSPVPTPSMRHPGRTSHSSTSSRHGPQTRGACRASVDSAQGLPSACLRGFLREMALAHVRVHGSPERTLCSGGAQKPQPWGRARFKVQPGPPDPSTPASCQLHRVGAEGTRDSSAQRATAAPARPPSRGPEATALQKAAAGPPRPSTRCPTCAPQRWPAAGPQRQAAPRPQKPPSRRGSVTLTWLDHQQRRSSAWALSSRLRPGQVVLAPPGDARASH